MALIPPLKPGREGQDEGFRGDALRRGQKANLLQGHQRELLDTTLYYTILYYPILYCTVQYYTILCYAILNATITYCTIMFPRHPHAALRLRPPVALGRRHGAAAPEMPCSRRDFDSRRAHPPPLDLGPSSMKSIYIQGNPSTYKERLQRIMKYVKVQGNYSILIQFTSCEASHAARSQAPNSIYYAVLYYTVL